MKIIEALKEIKRLDERCEDLTQKVGLYCADLSHENPAYGPEQKKKIDEWLQSIHDTAKQAMELAIRIQKTNLRTMVVIELGGIQVQHSIAEWILRRRRYAQMEGKSWSALSDRALKGGTFKTTTKEDVIVSVRRYFDPVQRDKMVEVFRGEPGIIDRTLEVVNATTELAD